MLEYVRQDPVHRRWHHNQITFSMLYSFTENFVLPFSHDEVVHGKRAMLDKMPGDAWQKHATLRALYGYMFGHPGKKLMFMGAEIGQWREWDHDSSLDWHLLDEPLHRGLQAWVRDLNLTYQREPFAARGRFRGAGFQLDRLPGQREQRDLDDPPRAASAGLHGDGRELHAGAEARLPRRRARERLVPRGPQQRRRALRREQPGQRRRPAHRACAPLMATTSRSASSSRPWGSCCSRSSSQSVIGLCGLLDSGLGLGLRSTMSASPAFLHRQLRPSDIPSPST